MASPHRPTVSTRSYDGHERRHAHDHHQIVLPVAGTLDMEVGGACGRVGDGRGVLVSVTPKGRRAFQRAQEQRLTHFAEAVESLTDEQLVAMRDLASALERLTVMLNK